MPVGTLDLWSLVRTRPELDPRDLAEAVCAEVQRDPLDYRERLLVRDSVEALRIYWGEPKFNNWLARCPDQQRIEAIRSEAFDEIGYPSLRRRLMEKTHPDDIRQYLAELGKSVRRELRIYVAGSVALIFPGLISRYTEDIDVVGEIPEELRTNYRLLDELEKRYGLHLGHVQTHYFPMRWQDRAHSLAEFGQLRVFLLDPHDVFMSKLFSSRTKDRDDLRVLAPHLDKSVLIEKLKTDAASFLAAPRLQEIAHDNWQILYGEALPT